MFRKPRQSRPWRRRIEFGEAVFRRTFFHESLEPRWLLADFGDAPAPYPTLLVDGGASHETGTSYFLGSTVDDELDGLPSPLADGDDLNALDDEDGVTFIGGTRLIAGDLIQINVVASDLGALNAWVDFNSDGDWADPNDQIFFDEFLFPGPNTIFFFVPFDVTPANPTYARFRFDSFGGLGFDGPAADGEVEDYAVAIVGWDYGDAPDPLVSSPGQYPTLRDNDGPRHWVPAEPTVFLGPDVDAEPDGQPDPSAKGDDANGNLPPGDENGVAFHTPLVVGESASITVVASVAGVLDAWIDYDQDGIFELSEKITAPAISNGANNFSIPIPASATLGQTFARFRFSTVGGLGPGLPHHGEGEVEDHAVQIVAADYGDAPDPFYPTLSGNNGPRHALGGPLFLGTSVDGEPNGQPNATALGDDNDGTNDDDGVSFTSFLAVGEMATVDVVASTSGGILNAWVDFDLDRTFAGQNEQIFANVPLSPGLNSLSFPVPDNAAITGMDFSFARFRVDSSGGLSFDGLAFDGEVEDYAVRIYGVDFGDAPDPTYPTTRNSNGARHVVNFSATILGNYKDYEADGQPSNNATDDDAIVTYAMDEIGVNFQDISTTGVALSLNDDEVVPLSLPFLFDYFGTTYAQIHVSSNGFLTVLGELHNGCCYGGLIPSASVPNGVIAGWWEDLNPPAGGTVYHQTLGTPGNRTFITQFDSIEHHPSGNPVTFQFKIFEATDVIEVHYPNGAPADDGPHTAGIENQDGTVGLQFFHGTTALPPTAVRYTPIDDEDGVRFTSSLLIGQQASIEVHAVGVGLLNAWIDFNDDGDWNDPDEQIFNDYSVFSGTTTLFFNVPADATATNQTFARFRYSTFPVLSPTGLAQDGEVEDYAVPIFAVDFGDAPDSFGTTLSSNGAQHRLSNNIMLGTAVDAESDGQPSTDATGDGADEDGIDFFPPLVVGEFAEILVNASAGAFLDFWIDIDQNGVFDHPTEHINAGASIGPLPGGEVQLNISIPPTAIPGTTFARLRISSAGELLPTGLSLDGEVEDYQVEIVGRDFGDAPDGVVQVADIDPASGLGPYGFTELEGDLFFGAFGPLGSELYRYDSSTGMVGLVHDINPSGDSAPHEFTELGGDLFFSATGPVGDELYRYDSSTGMVGLVHNIHPSGSSLPREFTELGGDLFFGALGPLGSELYRYDSSTGTVGLVHDINPSGHSTPIFFTELGGDLFFRAIGPFGSELYRYDSSTGMVILHDINPSGDSFPFGFTELGGDLFFSATGPLGNELYRYDSSTGTVGLVADINPSGPSAPREFTELHGDLFFSATGPLGDELYRYDSSTGMVGIVHNIHPSGSSFPREFTELHGDLFFSATGPFGNELYRYDSSTGIVRLVHDINPAGGSVPALFTELGGDLFFRAFGPFGEELYRYDSSTGTVGLVADINPSSSSLPVDFTEHDGDLFFSATGPDGRELFAFFGSYPTNLENNGAYHLITSDGPFLGSNVDNDADGQSSAAADGDDTDPDGDDDDGVMFLTELTPGGPATISVEASSAGRLNAWIDFDNDGVWSPEENLFAPLNEVDLFAGTTNLTIHVPDDAKIGPTYARFRFSTNGGLSPTGHAADGEVEDYLVNIIEVDAGDAPDPLHATFRSSDGPRHKLESDLFLGDSVDRDPDGQPTFLAEGDDDDGNNDDDGVVFTSHLIAGQTATFDVIASQDGGLLNAWIDFDLDGFETTDQIFADTPLAAGLNQLSFSVPADAVPGNLNAFGRFRLSTTAGLGPSGFADDGEVEDYIVTIRPEDFDDQDLVVSAPLGNGSDDIVVRLNGFHVEVFDNNASSVLAAHPLFDTKSVTIHGAPDENDQVTVDYSFGGFFELVGGIHFTGGIGGVDRLTVQGTGGTIGHFESSTGQLGDAKVRTTQGALSNDISFIGIEPVDFVGFLSMQIDGVLAIDGQTLTLEAASPTRLGLSTILNGAIINAPGGLSLGAGQSIFGTGTINGRVAADVGSLIDLSGNLNVGDSASVAGFFSRGELRVRQHEVTMHDANQVALGSLTIVGDNSGNPGKLTASNGAVVDFGDNLIGVGTIDTPNDPLKPLINNGEISGHDASAQITLPGFVKGVGRLNHVNVTGTNSFGFSPAIVYFGSVTYGASSTTIVELGGTTPGSNGHDQLNHTGTATLGGTLNVQLYNGFTPSVGDSFTILTADGGIINEYENRMLPTLPPTQQWQIAYGGNDLVLSVIPIPVLPSIVQVMVGSTSWSNAFRANIFSANDGFYPIRTDADQLKSVPWGINQVRVRFSENVSIQEDDLFVSGTNNAEYAVVPNSLQYDNVRFEATWEIAPVSVDKLYINVADAVTSVATGFQLDGDYTTGAGLPSGDGTAGGHHHFRVNVLAGDADRNGENSLNDLQSLATNWQQATTLTNFFVDFDGSNNISLNDLQSLATNWQKKLSNFLDPLPHNFPAPAVIDPGFELWDLGFDEIMDEGDEVNPDDEFDRMKKRQQKQFRRANFRR